MRANHLSTVIDKDNPNLIHIPQTADKNLRNKYSSMMSRMEAFEKMSQENQVAYLKNNIR